MLAIAATAGIASAATVVEMDFNYLNNGDTIADGTRLQDVSGNGYHGFWGGTGGNTSIVSTVSGTGIDNSTGTNPGHVFLRDGMTGVPDAWDGPTTTVSPYFTLNGSGSFTYEAIINWNNTSDSSAGIMGGTSAGGAWMRERNGEIHYAFGAGDAVNRFDGTIDVSAAKADGNFHHLALVYDGTAGEVRFYLDSTLLDTNTDADIGTLGTLLNGTDDFRLGNYNGSASEDFQGIMDHFRISDTALTTGEFLTVPEPSSTALLGLGGLALILRRRK